MPFFRTAHRNRTPMIMRLVKGSLLFLLLTLGPVASSSSTPLQQPTLEQSLKASREAIDGNRYKDAKKEVKRALKMDPNSAEAHLLMALINRHENNRREAIKQIYEAIKSRPDSGEAHYLMAVLLYETTETAQAALELEKAFKLGVKAFNPFVLKGD